jgi:hypothetical protein
MKLKEAKFMKKNLLSIKTKVISALLLGACLTFSLPANTAFAATGDDEQVTIQIESISPVDEAIYNKQVEIDQYLFKEHAKDIEEKGFKVLTTGVANGKVEVGITPYSEENADYLYGLFGKDMVTIIETADVKLMDEAVTSMPESTMVITAAPDTVNTTVAPDSTVAADAVITKAADGVVTTTAADLAITTTAVQEKAVQSSSFPTAAVFGGLSVLVLGGIYFAANKRKAVK